MKQPDYGNWIPKKMMERGWALSACFLLAGILSSALWKSRLAAALFLLLFALDAALCCYMQLCRRAFSFTGGNVMGQIHGYLLSKLRWSGKGRLLDIGCGSGALTIRCAKAYPQAKLTGIDFWGREWNYAMEQTDNITFQQGDAAKLPFEAEFFDAAVSNFVFHEVKSQPDKRKVVREALRVVKKGGSFAFHDLFEQKKIYGDMDDFISLLRSEGITELHYEPHTEKLSFIPGLVKAPWLLSGTGLLYGIK